jgi:hypothetical protein
MKKTLAVIAAVALGASAIWWLGARAVAWLWAGDAVAASAERPWPEELGTLDSVAGRYPPLKANDASVRLSALAKALPKDDAVDGFVRREIARDSLTIGAPPALVDVSAIRELALREPIVWERRSGIGDAATSAMREEQMTVARALVASALAKARAGDAAAWEDLRAVWTLACALDPYPQMMLQTASFSMARMVNAVAWKMPLPAPAWFDDVQQRDYVARLLEAFQYQAASYWGGEEQMLPTMWLAKSVEHDRLIAEEVADVTRCEVTVRMNELGTDLSFVWRRAFRYRAEREATANALRVREGKPIESVSRCSDGGWTLEGTTLRFGREIATAATDKPMPLVLHVEPASAGGR